MNKFIYTYSDHKLTKLKSQTITVNKMLYLRQEIFYNSSNLEH